MADRKLRVMLANEASFLATGYGVYGMEVLRRLYAMDKYELCEYATYGEQNNPRAAALPWKFISAMPSPLPPDWDAHPTWQFGEALFEKACLEFKPDVVCSIRDFWMDEYQLRSPFRRFFKWAIMPTVDSDPQEETWISAYLQADAVFTYSDYGTRVLKEQGGELIKFRGTASPAADGSIFKPAEDRIKLKADMGLPPNSLIIGTVMRNQKRKLYPDLLEAFAQYLKEAPPELAKRTYLYLHTSYPDLGWDIPRFLRETGVSNRVFFTYSCLDCGISFPSRFHDARASCLRCGKQCATLPSTQRSSSREMLARVFNCMDAYVQYAICEGFGMPMVEAASCGTPVFAVDYSAMSDVVRKINGFPVAVGHLFREAETQTRRSLPSNNDLVRQLIGFFSLPESLRARKRFLARRGVEKHYSYDKTAQAWADYFDTVPVRPHSETWDSPPVFVAPVNKMPGNLTDEEFIRWGMSVVAGRPDLANSLQALRMARDVHWQSTSTQFGGITFNENSLLGVNPRLRMYGREEAVKDFLVIATKHNEWEQNRTAHQ